MRAPKEMKSDGGAPAEGAQLRLRAPIPLHQPQYYEDIPLGAIYSPESTVFRVFAPTAEGVSVVIAEKARGSEGLAEHPLKRRHSGIWEASVAGDLAGRFYAWRLRGRGFDERKEIADIYAICAQGRGGRTLIVDPRRLEPDGFRVRPPAASNLAPVDAIIYELHVRDMTIAGNSGVRQKGKYLGLTESGTHLPRHREVATGLDHLAELGVTHVQLMPVQDFDNDETRDGYDWGYMPVQLNSPEGCYASSPAGAARIAELKAAIHALHQRGIGVILDVVYNHTSARAGFERLVPGYYYRMLQSGAFSNGSGCGNEFDSASPMSRKFIIDSLAWWLSEYQVDGFRLDLMGLIDLETLLRIRDELRRIKPDVLLYGEPWAAGKTPFVPLSDKSRVRGTGIGAFNDHFRDAVRGDRDGTRPGFVQGAGGAALLARGLAGAIDDWSHDPSDAINYFECHDNLTMWDKLAISVKGAEAAGSLAGGRTSLKPEPAGEAAGLGDAAVRKRMLKLATLALLTAQGTPLLHAGQEFCRSKRGNPNSYNAGDEINAIDWSLKREHRDVFAYTQALIAIRKAHPAFRLRTRKEVHARVSVDARDLPGPSPEVEGAAFIAYHINGRGLAGEKAKEILVLLNGGRTAASYRLPRGRWQLHANAEQAGPEPLSWAEGVIELPPHSGMLLMRQADVEPSL